MALPLKSELVFRLPKTTPYFIVFAWNLCGLWKRFSVPNRTTKMIKY